jgi:chromosome segregation ATPase
MKDTILQIIGLIIIITPISITIWSFIRSKPYAKPMLLVSVISVFIGLPLIIINRITEITVGRVGTIKAATKQVTLDAEEVSKLRKRVESQSATIDLVAQNATDAKKLSTEAKNLYEDLSNKNILADKELKNISKKILPLESKAKSLSTLIRKRRKEILHLQELLDIQQLMIASIAGSRSDYEKLTKIAGKISRIQTYVNSAIYNGLGFSDQ